MLGLKILLAEQDKELATITKNYLVRCGYSVRICLNGEEALQAFRKDHYDFVLTNIDLPGVCSIDLVKEIRHQNRFIPVIFIGSNPHRTDIIRAFNVGADDFVARPVNMEELDLRIRAIQKRVKVIEERQHFYKIGQSTLDTLHNVISCNGEEKGMTTKELDLFFLLYEFVNHVVERPLALKRVWHSDNYFNARNMDVYVRRLRKILSIDPSIKIENVHGVGYRLIIQP